jgi:hypothetical protein
MNKTIPLDKKFIFCFLEEKDIRLDHPISDYYFKINDLSINANISFKWIFWGFYFFNSISEEIKKPEYSIKFVLNKEILDKWDFSKKKNHILMFNDTVINSEVELIDLIEKEYSLSIFDENTKIHIKLKINLDEYLLITNCYFPTLACFE